MVSQVLPSKAVAGAGRRRRWLGWAMATLVLLMGLGATVAAWRHSQSLSQAEARYAFEVAANKVVSEIAEYLDAHVQTLWGVSALLASNPKIGREQWETYIAALNLDQRLPSTRGVGFATYVSDAEIDDLRAHMNAAGFSGFEVRPEGRRDSYHVVTHIAPFGDRNYSALGYDLSTRPERRAPLELARDQGRPVLSAKVGLLSDRSPQPQPGFLLYVPTFRSGQPLDTVAQRRAAFLGIAYSPFRAREFIFTRSIQQQLDHSGMALEVFDGAGTGEPDLLFRTENFPDLGNATGRSKLITTVAERASGRTWTFRFAQARTPAHVAEQQSGNIIMGAGVLISILASLVVGSLALNRAQAIESAERLREDVARREQAEERLRQSEAKFRSLFDNIPIPTFAIDRETLRVLAVNEAAVERYGYSRKEFLSMRTTDIRPREDVPRLLRFMEAVRDQERYSGEFRHQSRDGKIMDVDVVAHTLELEGRRVTIVSAQDITERKRAERALAESEQQLRQVQKLEAVGQLTGGIAHDFNNILTVITGTIEILAEGVAHEPKLAAIARLIDEAATRGSDLTRDLLAFARRQPLQPRDVDANELVSAASKLFRPALGEHIEIECRFEKEPWRALVDPNHLTTALLNLALNARDAMPFGGRILLETANVALDEGDAIASKDLRAGAYVMIALSDNGSGIPAAVRDKVFEPFFTTKEVGKGTGLGLSMVYGFVKQSGGHVQIYSEEGYGTTVRLYLPRATSTAALETTVAPPDAIEGGHETVLVVEDDALVRDYVTGQLRSLGYVTLVAANASEALAIADRGERFDLLFTDVIMPGPMNGRHLAKALRERHPGLRVLFTSGFSDHATLRSDQLEPGEDMLNKPYRKADLARKVRAALDEPAAEELAMT
jgi:PAS domain S-box-containing protein